MRTGEERNRVSVDGRRRASDNLVEAGSEDRIAENAVEDILAGAQELGVEMEAHIQVVLEALTADADKLGL